MGAKSCDGSYAWSSIINSILSVCHAGRRNTKREAREVAIMAALVDKRGGHCEKTLEQCQKTLHCKVIYD
jgi:hypothetical protein